MQNKGRDLRGADPPVGQNYNDQCVAGTGKSGRGGGGGALR